MPTDDEVTRLREALEDATDRIRRLEAGHGQIIGQMSMVATNQGDLACTVDAMAKQQQELVDRFEAAIERGLENALGKLIDKKQQQAKEGFVRWVWSNVKSTLSRFITIGAIVLFVGKFFGIPAAVSLVDSIFKVGK